MKKIVLSLAVLLGAMPGITAASWNNDADAKLPQSSRRVVMMGNSITEYWKWHDQNNHAEFFDENGALDRGIAATQTPSMVNRFTADVVNLKPLVTVLAGGVNDLNDKSTPEEVFANTRKMAEMAVAAGIRPILATINPSGWSKDRVDKYIAYNKLIKQYCDDNGYSFCNYFDAVTMGAVLGNFQYSGDYNEMKYEYRGRTDHSDHLHPGREGYLVMESVLIPLIEENIWKGNVYEAENAVKFGPQINDVADENCSGGTFVGALGSGNSLKIGYTAPVSCKYYFTVDYCTAGNRKLTVSVNDDVYTIDCPSTGSFTFDNVGQVTFEIELQRGYNTIIIGNQDTWAPNVDRFSIKRQTLADLYPTFSILGDSYSTYQGWIDAGVDFGGGGYEYPQGKYDLASVDDTWWKRFEAMTGCKLEQNNSISGTCMSYIGLGGSGSTKTVSFVNRVTKMRKAALFIIEGGTNDFVGGRTRYSNADDASLNGTAIVGDYKWDGFGTDMPDYRYVRPSVAYMISYLQTTYPECTVVFMANDQIPAEGKNSFREICEHYGAIYYEMHDIVRSVDNPHPMKAGMESIAEQLIETLNDVNGIQPVTDSYYLYNVGAQKWLKVGNGSNEPTLGDIEERTLLTITQQFDGYKICSNDLQAGWGVDGRNLLTEDNGGASTARWGTSFVPGWHFTSSGDSDGSVYIKYTWDSWKKGSVSGITDPSNTSYGLFYGDWALGTYRWSNNDKKDVEGKTQVFSDFYDNITSHGDYAKWIIIPTGDMGIVVERKDVVESGVAAVETEDEDVPTIYYNLQGLRVENPGRGFYIARTGAKTSKVYIQ